MSRALFSSSEKLASWAIAGDPASAAQATAQDTLAATLGLIIGTFALAQPADTAIRDDLLEPILKQNEAMRQIFRRRRTATDVDPQTGDELPAEPDAGKPPEAAEPAPADGTGESGPAAEG